MPPEKSYMKSLLIVILFIFPNLSFALNCKSENQIINAIEKSDYGINLHIFRSHNLLSKDINGELKKCSWQSVKFGEYKDYETYPSFKAQYLCRGTMGSPFIQFDGICVDREIKMQNIKISFEEGQHP